MMKDDFIAGGSAFPHANHRDANSNGMTLRDYFAAKVMQALVQETSVTADDYFKAIAKLAYSHADAMIAQRGPQSDEGKK